MTYIGHIAYVMKKKNVRVDTCQIDSDMCPAIHIFLHNISDITIVEIDTKQLGSSNDNTKLTYFNQAKQKS